MAIIKVINKGYRMNKLYKKDGTQVEVNDSSLEYALSIGWTKTKPKAPVKKKATKKAD